MSRRRTPGVLVLAVLALWAGRGHDATAQFAEDVCDPTIWESLEARAWLEAEREIAQNQNLVFKPDSVLEYSCFHAFLGVTGAAIGPIFTEHQAWGPVHDLEHLDRALHNLVMQTIFEHVFVNFGPTYLGRRVAEITAPWDATGGYHCEAMAFVWEIAKCWNVMTDPQDGVYAFEHYAAMPDVRRVPDPFEPDGRWGPFLDIAMRDPPWYPALREVTVEGFERVRERLMPGVCDLVIPVHIMIRTDGPVEDFPYGFCPNPGCTYDGGGCQ
jgi:hypothetical protein